VVVIAFHPLRTLLERVVDRLRFDKLAARALAELGQRLESTLTPEAVLPAIVETIATALKLPYVAVEVGSGAEVIARAASGEAPEHTVAIDLVHQNEQVGRVVVAPRSPGGQLDPAQRSLLSDLAHQAGVAAYVVRLTSELARSRSRVVAAADAERRRIERNLHDGAQQHLVALAINLRLARDLADNDPQTVKTMLDQVGAEIHDTLQELRDLARGIYPPLLTERGLGEALPAAAARSPVATTVDTTGIGRYPTEVEAAVYFCCVEALQNATKHAGPTASVAVRVWDDGQALRFQVSDDGSGFDTTQPDQGQGLANMRDRLGAIGGTLEVRSAPGHGTTVSGVIPRS
jgi:signal transduction histidine kinase